MVYVVVVVLLNVITDIYLLSIPLPLLWQVKISMKQKIPLMGLFSGAAFVITASIIRAVMITTVSVAPCTHGLSRILWRDRKETYPRTFSVQN